MKIKSFSMKIRTFHVKISIFRENENFVLENVFPSATTCHMVTESQMAGGVYRDPYIYTHLDVCFHFSSDTAVWTTPGGA